MHRSESVNNHCRGDSILSAEQLFSLHGNLIRSVIRFYVKDEVEQDEIYQELFLYFARKPITEEIRNVQAFLYHVVRNLIKDRQRQQIRYERRLLRYADEKLAENQQETPEDSAVHMLEVKEQAQKVLELLERHLSENEVTAIRLRYNQDCDLHETARRMNLQPNTVSRYVCIGMKKIRAVFGGQDKANKEEGE